MLKPIIKEKVSGELVTSGISDVAIASVHSPRKTSDNDYDIICMNKSQESRFFTGTRNIDFRYATKAKKVMVDFKFDAVYR